MIDLSDEKIYTRINESKNIEIRDKINNITKNTKNDNKINKDINEDTYNNKNNIYLLIIIVISFIIIYYFTKS